MTAEPEAPVTGAPAHVSAQLSVRCVTPDGSHRRHRIWIARDGSVSTPDHDDPNDSVITALGGKLTHPCSYWTAAGQATVPALPAGATPPGMKDWQFDGLVTSWTSRSVWTAVSAIAADLTFTSLDPVACLAFAQVFTRHGGELPNRFPEHVQQLLTPSNRPAGFRRTRATTAAELEALLDAGMPPHNAASAAALDFDAATIRQALHETARLNAPPDFILLVGSVLRPTETVELMSRLDRGSVARAVSMLPSLTGTDSPCTVAEVISALSVDERP